MRLKCSINFEHEEFRTVSFSGNGCRVPLHGSVHANLKENDVVHFGFVYAGIAYTIAGKVVRKGYDSRDVNAIAVAIHFDSIPWDVQNLFKTF